MRNVEYSLLCTYQKEAEGGLEDYKRPRLVTVTERKQSGKLQERAPASSHNGVAEEQRQTSGHKPYRNRSMYKILNESVRSSPDIPAPQFQYAAKHQALSFLKCGTFQVKSGKTPGSYNITPSSSKPVGTNTNFGRLRQVQSIVDRKSHPSSWKGPKNILLHKKMDEDTEKLSSHLLAFSHFTSCLRKLLQIVSEGFLLTTEEVSWIGQKLHHYGPSALNQLLERTRTYRLFLCLLFVDYEKETQG